MWVYQAQDIAEEKPSNTTGFDVFIEKGETEISKS